MKIRSYLMAAAIAAALVSPLQPASAEGEGDATVNPGQEIITEPSQAVSAMGARIQLDAGLGDADAVQSWQAWQGLSTTQKQHVADIAGDERFLEVVATGATDRATLDQISPDLVAVEVSGQEIFRSGSGIMAARLAHADGAAFAPPPPTTVYYDVTSWWSKAWRVFGVDITKVKLSFDYQTNARTVTQVYSCQGTSHNYAPTRSISGREFAYRISNNTKGRCKIAWKIAYSVVWVPTPFHREFGQNMDVNGREIERKWFT